MKRPSISQRITVLDNLGLAYHSVGRLAEALQVQRTSLELAQVHEAEAVLASNGGCEHACRKEATF